MVDIALFPLDSIKTRVQADSKGHYLSTSHPYSGLLSSTLASFPCAATFWATYCTVKRLLRSEGTETHPAAVHVAAAVAGGTTSSVVRAPFEIVKQQMQLRLHENNRQAVRAIVRAHGALGLFTGLSSLIGREVPFDVLEFLLYEYLKYSDYGGEERSLWTHLLHGAVAGGCAALATNPVDVVKTRIMTQSGRVYRGLFQSLRLIYRTEGAAVLWAGWQCRLLYTSIGGTLFFGTFEGASSYLATHL